MDVFTEIVTPTLFYDEHLFSLVVCRMVNLSLEYGNCDGSCFGYAWFSMCGRAAASTTTRTDIGSASSVLTWSRSAD